MIVSLINCGTSIFAGFVIFTMMGYMSHILGVPVPDVVKGGKTDQKQPRVQPSLSEFNETSTTTRTKKSLNKRSRGQYNGFV